MAIHSSMRGHEVDSAGTRNTSRTAGKVEILREAVQNPVQWLSIQPSWQTQTWPFAWPGLPGRWSFRPSAMSRARFCGSTQYLIQTTHSKEAAPGDSCPRGDQNGGAFCFCWRRTHRRRAYRAQPPCGHPSSLAAAIALRRLRGYRCVRCSLPGPFSISNSVIYNRRSSPRRRESRCSVRRDEADSPRRSLGGAVGPDEGSNHPPGRRTSRRAQRW